VFLVLEKHDQTLLDYCRATPVPDFAVVSRLLCQLAAGLCYARSKGISHLDLKLENIMLDDASRNAGAWLYLLVKYFNNSYRII